MLDKVKYIYIYIKRNISISFDCLLYQLLCSFWSLKSTLEKYPMNILYTFCIFCQLSPFEEYCRIDREYLKSKIAILNLRIILRILRKRCFMVHHWKYVQMAQTFYQEKFETK